MNSVLPKDAVASCGLHLLFFLSGISALLYQSTWQRLLFTSFGVDLESTTIIICVFMFGLGVGGLLGGMLADRFPQRQLHFFALSELLIACFGWFSVDIILTAGEFTLSANRAVMALSSFALMALPICLMGMTFPLLVTYMSRSHTTIGRAAGSLYGINTLGAALGAYLFGFVLLRHMDLDAICRLAAFANLAIAAGGVLLSRKPCAM